MCDRMEAREGKIGKLHLIGEKWKVCICDMSKG